MNKLIIVVLSIILTSCTVIKSIRTASFIDFTKYEGFYLSQSPTADFKYTPLGLVTSYVKSGSERRTGNEKRQYDSGFEIGGGGNYIYVPVKAQDAVDMLYKKAKEMGATGILNIQVTYLPDASIYFGYSASGMAIKKE